MKPRASFVVFVYFIAANLPLWLASHSLSLLVKGLFNVEFWIIGALSFFLRRGLVICLLLAAIVLDLLNCINKTYIFSTQELFLSAPSLLEFAPSHLWSLSALAICILLVGLLAILAFNEEPTQKERVSFLLTLTIAVIVCGAVDYARGQFSILHPDRQIGQFRLLRDSARPLILSGIDQRNIMRAGRLAAETPIVGASSKLAALDPDSDLLRSDSTRPNIVFIVVESWGKPLSDDVDQSLVRPYMGSDLAERYMVSRGTVPFNGATVSGELRELCGSTLGLGVISASAAQLKNCLPARLGQMGYHTVGVHGFQPTMFSRGAWYQKMRFEETWFRGQLEKQGLPVCPGPFPGICDASIAAWIGDRLKTDSESPQFIYWVTLNSHLPVPVPNLVKNPPACSEIASLAKDSAICSWYQLIFNVHRSVSELAMRPMTRPTAFVVVGDHTPPFSSLNLRNQFSDAVVPYIMLWPKSGLRDDSQSTRSNIATTRPLNRTRKPNPKKSKLPAHFPVTG